MDLGLDMEGMLGKVVDQRVPNQPRLLMALEMESVLVLQFALNRCFGYCW